MTLSGHKVALQPVTLRNQTECSELLAKAKELIASNNTNVVYTIIRDAMRMNPEVTDFIDVHGNLNQTAINSEIESIRTSHRADYDHAKEQHDKEQEGQEAPTAFPDYEPLPESEIVKQANETVSKGWALFLKDNQEVARKLYFDMTGYPSTLQALKLGVDIIKQTVDRKVTDADTVALIDSDITSDFWLDVSAHEVAQYVDTFLGRMQ